jgi:gamma-glutamyltranspeptidase / glutathione hydrolase
MRSYSFLLALAACSTTPLAPAEKGGFGGAVATANRHATEAAAEVLRGGGSAIDAAIAAVLVLGVVEPYSAGLGGGGFAMVYDAANDRVTALDFRERAPLAAHREMYLKATPEPGQPAIVDRLASRVGWRAVAVPGTAHGLTALHALMPGTHSLTDLAAPAVRLAEDGFRVTPLLRKRIEKMRQEMAADAAISSLFLPGGRVPRVGDTLQQLDLAKTLRRFGADATTDWRSGETAQKIVAAMRAKGGLVTLADLAAYRVHRREALVGQVGDLEVVTFPPPSSGGVHLLQMLDLLGRAERPSSPLSKRWLAHRVEVMRRAYQDRARYLGDPDFTPVPVAGLLSAAHLDALHQSIGETVTPSSQLNNPPPPGSPTVPSLPPAESHETTHLSVVDGKGNAVSLTFTINYTFGAAVVAPGTGVILNDEMDDFSAAPGAPNAYGLVGGEANSIAPGKTPLSSMTPTLVFRKNGAGRRLALVVGSPGGSTIITTVLQVITNLFWFGDDVGTAIDRPRVHHQWLPDCIFVDPPSKDRLQALFGANSKICAPRGIGNAQGIFIDPKGTLDAHSDPRGEGYALELP